MMIKDTDQQTKKGFALSPKKTFGEGNFNRRANRTSLGLVFTFSLLSASALYAQDTSHTGGPGSFDELDANSDGNISFDEFSSREAAMIDRLDGDANGVLTLDEFLNARPPHLRGRGPKHSPEKRADHGEDRAQPNAEQQARREDKRAQHHEKAAEHRAIMQQMIEARFIAADTNGDQQVTAAELMEATFLELDADNNGALTKQELAKRGGHRGNAQKPR